MDNSKSYQILNAARKFTEEFDIDEDRVAQQAAELVISTIEEILGREEHENLHSSKGEILQEIA